MSSYGNRCWTPERELITHRLVLAAMNDDDDQFEEIIDQAETSLDMVAVAALLAEQLAEQLLDGIECPKCPIEARIAELRLEMSQDATA